MSSSTTSSLTSTSTASHATSSSKSFQAPSSLKVIAWPSASYALVNTCRHPQIVGIILAIVSGILIGSSFVFKKKGLLRSQAGHAAGEGVAYLRSVCYHPVLRCTPKLTSVAPLTGIMVVWHDQCVHISDLLCFLADLYSDDCWGIV